MGFGNLYFIGRVSKQFAVNLIIIKDSEIDSNWQVRLSDRRAEHIHSILKLRAGSEFKIGILNQSQAKAIVLEIGDQEVLLEVSQERVSENPPDQIELIVALPRPQTLKKVLQVSAAMGVRRIVLTCSARVEKSYFQSSLLKAESIEKELLLGLEQASSIYLPEVLILNRFKDLLNQELSAEKLRDHTLLLAEPSAEKTLAKLSQDLLLEKKTKVLIAIGPEGGWVDFELEQFKKSGFTPFSMGQRILRVETAVCAVLAQIALLREL